MTFDPGDIFSLFSLFIYLFLVIALCAVQLGIIINYAVSFSLMVEYVCIHMQVHKQYFVFEKIYLLIKLSLIW